MNQMRASGPIASFMVWGWWNISTKIAQLATSPGITDTQIHIVMEVLSEAV
jgi:hypothetical protein